MNGSESKHNGFKMLNRAKIKHNKSLISHPPQANHAVWVYVTFSFVHRYLVDESP